MKRIEFIAPVEAMRGNLSGAQVLTYGDGKAWDITGVAVSPDLYKKGYIGAKRAANGRTFFSLKKGSTTNLGNNSRTVMALFGGACSLGKAASVDLNIISQLQSIFANLRAQGKIRQGVRFKGWLNSAVYPGLKEKDADIVITDGTTTVKIQNPWVTGGTGSVVVVPQEIVSKFSLYLG